MTQIAATMMKLNFRKTGVALALLSLGAACGGSDVIDSNVPDSGKPADSGKDTGSDGSLLDSGNDSTADSGLFDGGSDGSLDSSLDGSLDGGQDSAPVDGGKDSGLDGGFPLPPAVNLGGALNFVVLAKSAVSTVPQSAITGNVGVSPAAATFITGFSLTMDASNVFSISPQVVGKVYAADYTLPTPSNLTTAIGDMQTAFTDAAGRAPDVTELGAGDIGGMTLTRGVYKWSSGLLIPTNVTLSGSATDVFIFQIAQTLTVASAKSIILNGGVVPKNIFWQVSSSVELGTTSHFEGVILCKTAITMRTAASTNGRLLAQTAVNLDSNAVTQPAP